MRKSDTQLSQPPQRAKFDKRRAKLLLIAARCFTEQGYDAASMRDIAREMGILPGTIYYYFPSKESLLVAVHKEGVRRISQKIEAALEKSSADPWQRLSDAAAAYLESMLGADRDLASVIIAEFPRRHSKALRAELMSHREMVEAHFRKLVAELPLRRGVNRGLWRLALMGQLAWTHAWYRKGKTSPDEIARRLVEYMRRDSEN